MRQTGKSPVVAGLAIIALSFMNFVAAGCATGDESADGPANNTSISHSDRAADRAGTEAGDKADALTGSAEQGSE